MVCSGRNFMIDDLCQINHRFLRQIDMFRLS